MKKPKSNASTLNMSPEYRNELKELRGRERDLNKQLKDTAKNAEKERRRITREANQTTRGIKSALIAVHQRRAVLAGRLSK